MPTKNLPKLKQVLTSLALILLGMLISGVYFSGGLKQLLTFARPESAQAAEDLPSILLTHNGPEVLHRCVSSDVAVFPFRTHVQCTVPAKLGDLNISFFAVGNTDSSHTARLLTLLTMAHITGKRMVILFDPDESHNPPGCLPHDCRLLTSVAILR